MAYDINCPHCGYGYTTEELLKTNQLNKAGTFKANCKTLCKKDFEIEVVPSFNYFENKIKEAPMDLIEQLGGYENAKKFINGECADGFDVQGLRNALLEYRREHSIYEAGDKVVILTPALGNAYSWKVESFDGCMIELSQVGQPNEWAHITEITHATDGEIKAGHRL